MKKIVQLFMLIGLGLTLNSCYYNKYPIVDINPPAVDISFATEIQPIFNNNCVACHAGALVPDLRSGNAYAAITSGGFIVANDLAASKLYQRLTGNGNLMPPGGALASTNINLVKNWILQGAKNN